MLDFKLDPVTHDLVILGGDVVLIDGIEEYAQAIRIALRFIAREWFLDRTKGWIDFPDGMPFGKSHSQNEVRAKVQSVIAGVEGGDKTRPPSTDSISFDSRTRTLSIAYTAFHADGVIKKTVDVPL